MLDRHLPGTVELAPWLMKQGISRELQRAYKVSGWLEKIGPGAYKRPAEQVEWQGGLFAIQQQTDLPVHAGGTTALDLLGRAHFLRAAPGIQLFSGLGNRLPRWFKVNDWGQPVRFIRSSILPPGYGLVNHNVRDFTIKISSPERAMMECLFLAPDHIDLMECYHLMQGLSGLRPDLISDLLARCTSVKVKRLFLFLAAKAGHQWVHFLNTEGIDLGTGARSLVKCGVYNSEFQITVPRELAES